VLGEVRGGEAFDLLQALNTGHAGTLSTIHANGAEQALARFASCVVQSAIELPYAAVRQQISSAVDYVLHLERANGVRTVSEMLRIDAYDGTKDRYDIDPVFRAASCACETPSAAQP
jgi:pilus assembly protein CpaF